jgi:thiol-disulfide isomerase/thioredoxin
MKRITVAVAAMSVLATAAFGAQQWRNLTDENYYSGPKITADDLAGKVVLVDEWGINCPPCRALLPHMQKLWNANKGKPFVLIGSHRQGRAPEKVKELVDANKLTYPVYDYAGLVDEPSNGGGLPHMYVVNHRGKVVYSGRSHDECVAAVQAAIQAVGAMPTLCGGVSLKAFKSMEKQLVLGKPIKNQVKALQTAVKKGESKSATAVQQKQAEEAKEILAAIDESKTDIKDEIEEKKSTNPEEALKLVKAYITTFPAEGAAYKPELPELSAKAAEWKKAQKAAK